MVPHLSFGNEVELLFDCRSHCGLDQLRINLLVPMDQDHAQFGRN